MPRLAWLLTVFLVLVSPGVSQSSPEVDGLLDAFFAKDVDTVLKHLPPSVQEAFKKLSPQKRERVGRELLVSEKIRSEGENVRRSEDPSILALVESRAGGVRDFVLEKRISDGSESVLWIALRDRAQQENREDRPQEENRQEVAQITLRYVDGEWRVYEVRSPDSRNVTNLDDPGLIKKLADSDQRMNEASAVGTMRTYVTALTTYAVTYPDIGYPLKLDALGVNEEAGSSPDHSGLLDSRLSSPPYEKSGYRFRYRRRSQEEFTIVARPIKYGETGTRSFFADEAGVIRYTEEDREPSSWDAVLDK